MLSSQFSNIRRTGFDESSPVQPISEYRGGTLSVTDDGRRTEILVSNFGYQKMVKIPKAQILKNLIFENTKLLKGPKFTNMTYLTPKFTKCQNKQNSKTNKMPKCTNFHFFVLFYGLVLKRPKHYHHPYLEKDYLTDKHCDLQTKPLYFTWLLTIQVVSSL